MAKVEANQASVMCRRGNVVERTQIQEADRPGFQVPAPHTVAYCSITVPFFTCKKVKVESEVAQSCPTLSDPMECSLPGSSVHGIFQAGVLE